MIDANYILKTDLLDLLFDGRNKQYGAYELRKKYNKRMLIAVASMITCCLFFFALYAFSKGKSNGHRNPEVKDISLVKVETETKKPEVVPPPPKSIQPPVKTIPLTTPVITPDDIKPEEEMPPVDTVAIAKIGTKYQDGVQSDIIAPPIDEKGTGVIEHPKKLHDEDDSTYITVQIESEYPGGMTAWQRYLTKTLPKYYTEDIIEKDIQGRVIVQFIVDKEGNVSDVQGISGPNELREIAEKVILKSGKWNPAIQNGRQVKSYKAQPIVFQVAEQ